MNFPWYLVDDASMTNGHRALPSSQLSATHQVIFGKWSEVVVSLLGGFRGHPERPIYDGRKSDVARLCNVHDGCRISARHLFALTCASLSALTCAAVIGLASSHTLDALDRSKAIER